MGRTLKRRLLEVRIAKKNIRCVYCSEYIWKNSSYTFCSIRGFFGSHHDECFNKVSVSLETENTGDFKANQVDKRSIIDNGQKIFELINNNTLTIEGGDFR